MGEASEQDPGTLPRLRRWYERRLAPAPVALAASKFFADGMLDRAASLSYYAMLALFPALFVTISFAAIAGGDDLVASITDFARAQGAQPDTVDTIESLARRAGEASEAMSITIAVSLLIALNGASGVFNASGRAINAAFDVEDDNRGIVGVRLAGYAITIVVALLVFASLVLMVVGGDVARDLFDIVGLGAQAAGVWDLARWPAALLLALVALAIVRRHAPAPAARRRGFITTGTVVTLALWIAATIGFSFYVTTFGNYSALYGAFASAIVLLLWLFIMALGFLYGAELDGVLHRRRRASLAPDAGRAPERAAGDQAA